MGLILRKQVVGDWNDTTSESLRTDLTSIESAFNAASVPKAYVSLYAVANQSIPNSVWTQVLFDTIEGQDANNLFSSPGRIVVPVSGRYRLQFQGCFDNNATGLRAAKVQLNGVDLDGSGYLGTTASYLTVPSMVTVYLNANDYLEVFVYQSSGGSLNLGISQPHHRSRLSVDQL